MDYAAITQIIGKNVTQLRQASGLSRATVAAEIGISTEQLELIEQGSEINAAELYLLAVFYQCSPAELMHGLAGFSDDNTDTETAELSRNFLQVDQPNRGQLFSDFISQFPTSKAPE